MGLAWHWVFQNHLWNVLCFRSIVLTSVIVAGIHYIAKCRWRRGGRRGWEGGEKEPQIAYVAMVGVTMGYLHYVNCVCACVGGDVNDREEEGRGDGGLTT